MEFVLGKRWCILYIGFLCSVLGLFRGIWNEVDENGGSCLFRL